VSELIIHDGNAHEVIRPGGFGLIPRDFAAHPHGSLAYAKAFDLPLIPEGEWESRLAAQKAAKGQLSDIRNRGMNGQAIPARDQGNQGYCWAHSTVSAMLVSRAANNLPYADLSAYAIACIIKHYRNQGGWCGESVEFAVERGVPTSATWPQQSKDPRNDNAQTWADAAKHKVAEWMDLDPENMRAQLVTCLLLGIPVVSDFSWWSHSVCTIDLVSINPFQTRILNSWGNWNGDGTGLLQGRRAIPESAIALRVTTASSG
jgi:C1A family cysteine protease